MLVYATKRQYETPSPSQNDVLIWLEVGIIEKENEEFTISMTNLNKIVDDIYFFNNTDECVDFLTEITQQKTFMIISDDLQ